MGIKKAREIVREGVVLVTGEYLPDNFELVDNVIEPFGLYKVLVEKAVDLVIQDYFNNFPFYLIRMVKLHLTIQFFNIKYYRVPEGLERVISVKNIDTKVLIERIDDIEKFLESKEPCYRYNFLEHKLECRNTDDYLELVYIDKAVYDGNTYLSTDYCRIFLDSNLVIFAFCKELCISQSAPTTKIEYFNNKYINRLKYLIANEVCKENTVFDLSTNSNRLVRL